MVVFTFSILDPKYSFSPKSNLRNTLFRFLVQKIKNCQFKLKFDTLVVFTFSVLDWKYPFLANLVQKIKIVSLS